MNRSLTSRLITSLFAVAAIYLMAIAGALIEFGIKDEKQSALMMQEKLVTTVQASASIAAYVSNQEIAQEVAEGLLLHPEIISVTIRSDEGFHYTKRIEDPIANGPVQESYQYPLSSPIDGSRIGVISLTPNQMILDEKALASVASKVKLLVAQTAVLLIVTFIMINKVVGKPLTSVASKLTKLRPGDNTKLTLDDDHLRDEIGLVTESVNRFVESTTLALETERELREKISKMDKHYRSVLEKAQIALFVLDNNTRLIKGNEVLFNNLNKHLGIKRDLVMDQCLFEVLMNDCEVGQQFAQQAIDAGEPISREIVLESQQGSSLWVQLTLSAYQESDTGEWHYEGVIYDVTDRVLKTHNAMLLAQIDTLTGLNNRLGCRAFVEKFEQDKIDSNQLLAVLALDLDGFKYVNDTYGHNAGDEVLCIVAQRLQNQVRQKRDLVCRFGGDEFTVLIHCREDQIEVIEFIAQKIIDSLAQPMVINSGVTVSVGASIGISMEANASFEERVARADQAMYQVKNNGKNDYAVYEFTTALPLIDTQVSALT